MELTPTLTRRLFIASVVMMIAAVSLSVFNTATVLSAPLRTQVGVPSTVGFEGFLAQANGQPIPNGNYTIWFRVWDAAQVGGVKWDQEITNVQVTNGLYSVVLGGTAADPILSDTFNGNRWIGVTVPALSTAEISPRTQVSSVPFALNADNANKIGGGGVEGMVAAFDGGCPAGWTEFGAARGRVIVGVPLDGTLGGTLPNVAALYDLENRTHTHSFSGTSSGPSNTVGADEGSGTYYAHAGSSNHTHSISSTTAATSHVMPYIQLRYCKLNGS